MISKRSSVRDPYGSPLISPKAFENRMSILSDTRLKINSKVKIFDKRSQSSSPVMSVQRNVKKPLT